MCKRLICLMSSIIVLSMATVASAGLLVHYKLDETAGTVAVDASGNGFDGSVSEGSDWVDGIIDGALELWGTPVGSITLPADKMGLTSAIGSVALWMNMDVPTGINTLFWAGDNTKGTGFGPENEMHVHVESAVAGIWAGGELSFFANLNPRVFLFSDPEKGDKPENAPVNPKLVSDLEWHHVAATWGDGSAKLFIDGLLITEAAYVPTSYNFTHIFLGQMGGGSRTTIGMIDDARIYSHVLSSEEVDGLFKNDPVHVDYSQKSNPQEFVLNQNYPNPFNPSTVLKYRLPKTEYVMISIYSVTGQQVATIVDVVQNAGDHEVTWNAVNSNNQVLSSGVYLAKLSSASQQRTVRLLLMR